MDNKFDLLSRLSIDESDLPDPKTSSASRKRWSLVALGCFLLVTAVTAYLCWPRQKPILVKAATARTNGINFAPSSVLDATGYVVARRSATVSSKVTGRVVRILVDEGMPVRQDQMVARLDDTNAKQALSVAEAELSAAQSRLAEAQARLDQSKVTLERSSVLASQGMTSRANLDQVRADHQALKAQFAAQQQTVVVSLRQLEQQRQNIEDLILRAPFSGVVVARSAQPGEMISPVSAGGGFTRTGICTIVDMSSLEIEVDVNESYIERIKPGQDVQAVLDAYPDWKIPARVTAIIPTAERQKATVKVRVAFIDRDSRVLPEMGVKVAFLNLAPVSTRSQSFSGSIRVPSAALHSQGQRHYVFVIQDGVAKKREVTVERTSGNDVYLSAGLSNGEQFIADDIPGVIDGGRVSLGEI